MKTKQFIVFNDTIINTREIVHIKKVKYTKGCLNLGIRLTLCDNDFVEEWWGDDQRKRDERFNALKTELC